MSSILLAGEETGKRRRYKQTGQERSALRTHLCCLAARLLFLLAHGLLLIAVGVSNSESRELLDPKTSLPVSSQWTQVSIETVETGDAVS